MVNSTLDADDNGASEALTVGVLVIRYLFGLTGAALTDGAIGEVAKLTTPTAISDYLTEVRPLLDFDADGNSDALTDETGAIQRV